MYWIRLVVLLIVLAACVPVTPPQQLAHTPGPGVVIAADTYQSVHFRATIPHGWRVVTSAADDPVSVIFAAPEIPALLMLGTGITAAPAPAGYDGPLETDQQTVTLATGTRVTVILQAAPDVYAQAMHAYEQVLASLAAS